MPSLSQRIDALFGKEQWVKARALIEKELQKDPDSHWLLTRLGTTHYEERDYKKALTIARKAHDLAPDCPLVLWDLAGALDATGDSEGALQVYRKLIRNGPVAVGTDECGEGVPWAVSLLVDCVYRVALCYEHTGKTAEALVFYRQFLDLLNQGSEGIYTAEEAERRMGRLSREDPEYLERELGELRDEMATATK